jgi:peptidylprolyl isomerase
VKLFVVIGLLLCCLLLTSCGTDSEESTTPSLHTSEAAKWPALEKVVVREGGGQAVIPHGPPPQGVVVKDLVKGNGPPIRKHDWFVMSYVVFDYETRQMTEDRSGPSSFNWTYGVKELVPGWEKGLRGFREGGVRELFVPSRLAYGTGARVYVLKLRKLSDKPEKL